MWLMLLVWLTDGSLLFQVVWEKLFLRLWLT